MGGTFDPVHNGHLRTALEVRQWLGVERLCLMPARVPVHKEHKGVTAAHRLAMLQAAIADEPALDCDPREVISDKPSYSIYSLQTLRQEKGEQCPIIMLLGMDSFLSLDTWYRYQELLGLCHILVVARPGYPLNPNLQVQALLDKHQIGQQTDLLSAPAGAVLIHAMTPLDISSTAIRQMLSRGESPRYLIPEVVLNYITKNRLYQPN